jgi:ABC-type uncharacterized transport system substrate-binding protein
MVTKFFQCLIISFLMVLPVQANTSDQKEKIPVAVIYTKQPDPWMQLVKNMLQAIDDVYIDPVAKLEVNDHSTPETVVKWISDGKFKVIITLGNQPLELAKEAENVQIVSGGVLYPRDKVATVVVPSVPVPSALFTRFREISKASQTIGVIYKEDQHGWLMETAKEQAKGLGFKLIAKNIEKPTIKDFHDLIEDVDVLWVLQTAPEIEHDQAILDAAWEEKKPVISSQPALTKYKRAAVLGVYDDGFGTGYTLAMQSRYLLEGKPVKNYVIPLADELQTSANITSARYLALPMSREIVITYEMLWDNDGPQKVKKRDEFPVQSTQTGSKGL